MSFPKKQSMGKRRNKRRGEKINCTRIHGNGPTTANPTRHWDNHLLGSIERPGKKTKEWGLWGWNKQTFPKEKGSNVLRNGEFKGEKVSETGQVRREKSPGEPNKVPRGESIWKITMQQIRGRRTRLGTPARHQTKFSVTDHPAEKVNSGREGNKKLRTAGRSSSRDD